MFDTNDTHELQIDLFGLTQEIETRECSKCKVSQSIDEFTFRDRAKTARAFKCRGCCSKDAQARNDKANAEWLEKYGVTRTAVGLFCVRNGYKGLSPDDRLGIYLDEQSLAAAHKKRVDVGISRSRVIAECERKLRAVYKSRQRKDQRLTLNQAWMDWRKISPPDWWAERGMIPPSRSFSSLGAYRNYRYKHDPAYNLKERTKTSLRRQAYGATFNKVNQAVYQSRKSNKPFGFSVTSLVGYTSAELWQHIESQFTDGMCWERMAEIHIDHIIPVSWFGFKERNSDRDKLASICWSLDNLRPMWASDNIRKHANVDKAAVNDRLMRHLKESLPSLYTRVLGS